MFVRSGYDLRENDLYETPAWCVKALWKCLGNEFSEGQGIWEPSAGNHRIPNTIRQMGYNQKIYTSDIAEYDYSHDRIVNFFDVKQGDFPNMENYNIITNPPYGFQNRMATEYARHALKLCPNGMVALLLTMKFDSGKTRTDLFRDNPRFYAKITLLDRPEWFGNGGGTEDYAWYIWAAKETSPRMFWVAKSEVE